VRGHGGAAAYTAADAADAALAVNRALRLSVASACMCP
jgi:hypothetical protein